MKRLTMVIACALAVVSPVAHAQGTRIGIGIGLSSGGVSGLMDVSEITGAAPTSLYLPITFPKFRLEPELGYFRLSTSEDGGDLAGTVMQIGTGVFKLSSPGDNRMYFGARLGLTKMSATFSFSGEDSKASGTNVYFGPAVGGEHMFGDKFSLGLEGQAIYTKVGNVKVDGQPDASDASTSMLETRAVFFARWHF